MLFSLLCVSCSSTALRPQLSPEARRISGFWSNPAGGALTLNLDGTFALSAETRELISGKYEAHGDVLTFENRVNHVPGCDRATTRYRFTLEKGALFLRAIEDSCAARRARLSALWRTP